MIIDELLQIVSAFGHHLGLSGPAEGCFSERAACQ